jgi:alpha-tubulin suppressor-like RCC1 family protein
VDGCLGVVAGPVAAVALTVGCLAAPPSATEPPVEEPLHRLGGSYRAFCAIRDGGALHCWGAGNGGQLGDGAGEDRATPVAVLDGDDQPLTGVLAVTTALNHACAVMADRSVACWGSNGTGQLGDGGSTTRLRAETRVAGLADAVQVSALGPHTCAIDLDGAASCWGRNDSGELGNAAGEESLTAVSMRDETAAIADAVDVASGHFHTCLVRGDQRVWCTGLNAAGQLGRYEGEAFECTRDLPRAVQIADGVYLDGASRVAAGVNQSCAIAGGAVFCWGDPRCGQLGDGNLDACAARSEERCDDEGSSSPVPVALAAVAPCSPIQVGAGEDYACVLCGEGQVACWGYNAWGKLGNGETGDSGTPVRVVGVEDAVEIAVGVATACALLAGGDVFCWGDGREGELGNGAIGDGVYSAEPVAVIGLPP